MFPLIHYTKKQLRTFQEQAIQTLERQVAIGDCEIKSNPSLGQTKNSMLFTSRLLNLNKRFSVREYINLFKYIHCYLSPHGLMNLSTHPEQMPDKDLKDLLGNAQAYVLFENNLFHIRFDLANRLKITPLKKLFFESQITSIFLGAKDRLMRATENDLMNIARTTGYTPENQFWEETTALLLTLFYMQAYLRRPSKELHLSSNIFHLFFTACYTVAHKIAQDAVARNIILAAVSRVAVKKLNTLEQKILSDFEFTLPSPLMTFEYLLANVFNPETPPPFVDFEYNLDEEELCLSHKLKSSRALGKFFNPPKRTPLIRLDLSEEGKMPPFVISLDQTIENHTTEKAHSSSDSSILGGENVVCLNNSDFAVKLKLDLYDEEVTLSDTSKNHAGCYSFFKSKTPLFIVPAEEGAELHSSSDGSSLEGENQCSNHS